MVLLEKLKELADHLLGEDQRAKHLREEELQLAAAALLELQTYPGTSYQSRSPSL